MSWERIKLARPPCERIIAFSVPTNEIVEVCYDGILKVDLVKDDAWAFDREFPEGLGIFDKNTHRLVHEGRTYRMLGLFGGDPILRSPTGDELVLEHGQDSLVVRDIEQHEQLRFKYEDLSGDWAVATFSEDGSVITLGMPYAIYAFRRI